GDAACQVFSAHGSGIGIGLASARLLADALARAEGAEGYAVSWHRRWGGLLAGYDLFRKFSQTLSVPALERMMDAGLLDEETARAGMEQRMPGASAALLASKLASTARAPAIAARMAPVLARMAAAHALYARYPEDAAAVGAWSRRVARA